MILIEGNAAAAIGCMMAGVTFVGWYPITPSSSLCESLIDYLKKYRRDPETGKATYAVIQAEDELAALGMVIGAGWMGARAMTSTGRPRHLADGRVHRPRLLRRGAGGDLRRPARAARRPACRRAPASRTSCRPRVLSHGDTKHPLLLPASVDRVLHDGHGRVRPGRAAADAGLRDVGSRPRHEHLDGAAVRVPDEAARPRQAAGRRRAQARRRVRALPRRGRRRHPLPDGARRRHARRTSRADPATTRRRSTASAPTTTPTTSTGSRASSRRRGRWCRSPRSRWLGRGRHRHHRLRHDALGDRRVARPADERSAADDVVPAAAAYPFTPEVCEFIDRCDRVYVVEQNRDARCCRC